jgi:hypothetical protein
MENTKEITAVETLAILKKGILENMTYRDTSLQVLDKRTSKSKDLSYNEQIKLDKKKRIENYRNQVINAPNNQEDFEIEYDVNEKMLYEKQLICGKVLITEDDLNNL